jgi:hypothetical protein
MSSSEESFRMTKIDTRDVPRLRYRPCDHCGHRHYFLTDEGDADCCVMCEGALYPIVTIVATGTPPIELLQYVRHHPSCATIGGAPCNCGLELLIEGLPRWVKEHLGRHLGGGGFHVEQIAEEP